ncbi:MAG: germination protein YpeB [Clostridiaceae bacterium]|nr:germination protein YpeB [Clostridiaceae bacterium]
MEGTKKARIYIIIASILVILSVSYGVMVTNEKSQYRNYLVSGYSKNMYELINSVDNIRSCLTKANIIGLKADNFIIFSDIFRYSSNAVDRLNSLPIENQITGNTNKFLSQVGDFANSIQRKLAQGGAITDKDYETIEKLKLQSVDLHSDLSNAMEDINLGKINWGEVNKKAFGVFNSGTTVMLSQKFQDIQKQESQYPALIYDGPFSDNVQDIKPRIEEEKELSNEEAKERVREIIGKERVESISENKNKGTTKIKSFNYNIVIKGRGKKEGTVSCEISKNGGKVIYLLDSRMPSNPTMDSNKAGQIGNKFLKDNGFNNMISTYTLVYGNNVVISYVYQENGVVIYPDQIKVKIALDNGEITGVEAEKYLISHIENRKIGIPKVNQDSAMKNIGKNLRIKNIRLAIIPSENNTELLCYEFFGDYKNDNFFVYINSESGNEARILEIINTPNGALTM